MKFNAKASLLTVFAAAALLAGCGQSQTPEQRAQAQENVLSQLEAKDRAVFKQAGFEVVARTGIGYCNSNGEINRPTYADISTDITYVLKKSTSDNVTYTACMVHSANGAASMSNLKAVERYVTPGAPQQ